MEEIWAPVKNFPNYAVSNYGRVKNIQHNTILAPRTNSYGYHRVALRLDGYTYDKLVHQLVAEAFITGYTDGVKIKHANGDNGDNYVNNLRFMGDVSMGLLRREKDIPKVTTRKVQVIETGYIYDNVRECAKALGGFSTGIYHSLRTGKTYRGYTFQYVPGD